MSVALVQSFPPALDALGAMRRGASLEKALNDVTCHKAADVRAATQAILYTYTRQRCLCDTLIDLLTTREPAESIHRILSLALSELLAHPEKDYSIVNETISLCKKYRETERAAGFINACLRRFGREKKSLLNQALEYQEALYNAPRWYTEKVIESLGAEKTYDFFRVASLHPKLTLRVNRRKTTPEKWCERAKNEGLAPLYLGDEAVILDPPIPVTKIPGFSEGLVSVQDAGAQLAAKFLSPEKGSMVLDACAAPGGKTAHLLELFDVQVTALEVDPVRAEKINDNLERLGLKSEVLVGDASGDALGEKRFDAILLDAPCTASGILRRHPDIVFTRRPEDIKTLSKQQKTILEALWPRLKFGGKLLYVVCSVFKEEGEKQIEEFLLRHRDALCIDLPDVGKSMLTLCPSDEENEKSLPKVHDGFFYALLTKK